MEPVLSETAVVDRLLAFHHQLAALQQAGVTLAIDPRTPEIETQLELLSSKITLRMSRGQTIEQALQEERELPPAYRAAIKALLKEDYQAALEMIAPNTSVDNTIQRTVRQSILGPTLIALLAFGALVCLCLMAAPHMTSIYQDIEQEPGAVLMTLTWLGEHILVWAITIPLLLALFVWRCYRGDPTHTFSWAPLIRKQLVLKRDADLASRLATLQQIGISDERALEAATSSPDRMPPLLQWTLARSDHSSPEEQGWESVARFYDCRLRDRASVLSKTMPVVVGAIISGGIVMAYGYALFSPFVSLLFDLSQPALHTVK